MRLYFASDTRAVELRGGLLTAVDKRMEGRGFLVGDFIAADTIAGHTCLMSERCGIGLGAMPNLAACVEPLKARPALQKVLAL